MSKCKGNVVEPDDILDHQGADALRWYLYTQSAPWSPRRFSAEMVDEVVRKFLLTLWNTYTFFTLYANIDRFDPTAHGVAARGPAADRPLDRSASSHARPGRHGRARGVRRHGHGRADPASSSTTSPTGTCAAAGVASGSRRATPTSWPPTTRCTRCSSRSTKLLAPFTPFVAEELYQNLVRAVDADGARRASTSATGRSPTTAHRRGSAFDMATSRRIVELGRAARNAAAVKTRQPLAEVVVALPEAEAPRRRPTPRRRARRAQRQGPADRERRGRARRLRRQAEPQGARAQARQAAWAAPGGAQGGGRGGARRRRARGWRRRRRPSGRRAQSRGGGAPHRDRLARTATRSRVRGRPRRRAQDRGRRRAARGGAGARAHPRRSARAQSCRPPYRGHHQPDAGRAGGSCARRPSAIAARSWPRRWPASSRSARPPATTARRPGSTATRSVSDSA